MRNQQTTIREQNGNLIASVPMIKNRMFLLNIQSRGVKVIEGMCQRFNGLWYLRLGYLNFDSLNLLTKKNMVKGLPYIYHPNQLCEICLYEKQSQNAFSKEASYWTTKPLELVHTDLCGIIKSSSFDKNDYFMLFIMIFLTKPRFIFLEKSLIHLRLLRNSRWWWKIKVTTRLKLYARILWRTWHWLILSP